MKKLMLTILMISPLVGFCDPINEALMAVSHVEGNTVYTMCILTPPTGNPVKEAACLLLYNKYNASLLSVNSGLPLIPSIDPSPYAWSPYDICRFEPAHFVFSIEYGFPVCPTI